MNPIEKCQCSAPGFCPVFEKIMEENPPNWRWCQEASPKERLLHYQQQKKKQNRNLLPEKTRQEPIPKAQYKKIDKVAVVTSFFNPTGYKTNVENWHKFHSDMGNFDVDVYTIELSYDGKFYLPETKFHKRVDTSSEWTTLWQKERLLNIVIEQLDPSEYDAVCWIDADVIFENRQWVDDLREKLSYRNWCQLFDKGVMLNKDGSVDLERYSCGWYYANQPEKTQDLRYAHPGFAWGARLDWIQSNGGLIQNNIVGGGDTSMLHGIHFYDKSYFITKGGEPWNKILEGWAKPVRESGGDSFDYIPGTIYHLYHGTRKNKMYTERFEWLVQHNYDPNVDIFINSDGVIEWTEHAKKHKPQLIQNIKSYFQMRKEDD